MASHTPGPLVVDEHSTLPFEPRYRVYSKTNSGNVALFYGEGDAELFAAAPDMLAALKAAVESFEQLVRINRIPENMKGLRDARAAIARAEGRTSDEVA